MEECDFWLDDNNEQRNDYIIYYNTPSNHANNSQCNSQYNPPNKKTNSNTHSADAHIRKEVAEYEKSIRLLNQRNIEYQKYISSLQLQLKLANDEKNVLVQNYIKENDEIKRINSSLSIEKIENYKNINKSNENIIELNATVIKLKDDIFEQHAKLEKLQEANGNLLDIIEAQKREIAKLQEDCSKLSVDIDQRKEVKAPRKLMSKSAVNLLIKDEENGVPYNWKELIKDNHVNCASVFGFTPEQIKSIGKYVYAKKYSKSKGKSKKSKRIEPTKNIFLVFLYFFTRYPTIKVISDKFGVSPSSTQNSLFNVIESRADILFRKSIEDYNFPSDENSDTFTFDDSSDSSGILYSKYFIETNRSKCDDIALEYYCAKFGKYGVHVRCLHDEKTMKVINYYIENGSKTRICGGCHNTVDTDDWKNTYRSDENKERLYKKRMESKFSYCHI